MRHGQPPAWGAKHGKNLKQFLAEQPHVGSEEWQLRFGAYLDSTERFTRAQGGSLAYFVTHFDVFTNGPILEVKKAGGGANAKPTIGDAMRATLDGYREIQQSKSH